MVRSLPSEESFASCMLHDIELRISDSYQPDFLVENTTLRLQKYLHGVRQVAKERRQQPRDTVYVEPMLVSVEEHRDLPVSELLSHIITVTKHFVQHGCIPEHQQGGIEDGRTEEDGRLSAGVQRAP